MNIVDILMQDHGDFRAVFKRLEESPADAEAPLAAFSERVRRHARIENQILFPALQRAAADPQRRGIVLEQIRHGEDEHASVAKKLAETRALFQDPAANGDRRVALRDFTRAFLDHMNREETEILPLARNLLAEEQLDSLARDSRSIP